MRKFKTQGYTTFSESQKKSQKGKLYEKGENGTLKVNMKELDKLILKLRENSSIKISDLTDDLKSSFRDFVKCAVAFKNTSSYPLIYNLIIKHFRNISDVIPGTIGSYCAGCHISTNFKGDMHSCSPICASALPSKKSKSCSVPVIVANLNDGNFSFEKLNSKENEITNVNIAYIFVKYFNYLEFPGFSSDEKEKLTSQGIEKIQLYSMDSYNKYYPLLSHPINLSEIKNRMTITNSKTINSEKHQYIGIIIAVVVIILLALFFSWKHFQRK